MNKKEIHVSENRILLFITTILITIISTDTVYFGTNENVLFQKSTQMILCVFVIILFFYVFKKRIFFEKQKIILVAILNSCIILTSVVTVDFRLGYIFRCVLIFFSFFITQIFSIEVFAKMFNKIICFLSFISIICFFIEAIDHSFFSFAPRVYNISGYGFQNLFLYIQSDAGFSLRNYGIYREPGVFQIFIIVALLFEIYCFKQIDIKRIIVLSITLLTTLSTTGVIAFIVWIILFLFKNKLFVKTIRIKYIVCLMVMVSLLVGLLLFSFNSFFDTVFGKFNLENASFLARLSSVVVNIKIWVENPVFGVGLTNVENLYIQESNNIFGVFIKDNTNTILVQYAVFGMLFGILWTLGYLKAACALGKSKIERILIFLIIIILSVGEDLSFSPLGNVLMIYGLMYFEKSNSKKNERIFNGG